MKNTFETGGPEWQLFENWRSNESLFNTYSADAARYMEKANEARERAGKFRDALEKLVRTEI